MVTARIGETGDPAVVDVDAVVGWQDAHGVRRRPAAAGMDGVVGEPVGAGHVRPAWPRLVAVQHRCLAERLLGPRLHWWSCPGLVALPRSCQGRRRTDPLVTR